MALFNEGGWDRAVRVVAGILLLFAGWGAASGIVSALLIVAGAMALVTGVVGWCPAYSMFGVSSRKIVTGHCPHCAADHQG